MTTLERFLKEKRVYKKFVKNITHCDAKYFFERNGEYPNGIGCAFSWDQTKEGDDFWRDLSKEFDEYLKNQQK